MSALLLQKNLITVKGTRTATSPAISFHRFSSSFFASNAKQNIIESMITPTIHKTKLAIQQEGPNEFLIRIISEAEFKKMERKIRENITPALIRESIERFVAKLEQ